MSNLDASSRSPPPSSTSHVVAMTTQPSNESELQLYRVLQRANLLAYYDTFICQGFYFFISFSVSLVQYYNKPICKTNQ